MHTIQLYCYLLLFALTGWILLFYCMGFLEKITGRRFSLENLFFNFKQKIWMTIGLGCFALMFYTTLIYLSSVLSTPEARINMFYQVYQNPTKYIYWGLTFFAACSAAIYLARMFIKYIYNLHSK